MKNISLALTLCALLGVSACSEQAAEAPAVAAVVVPTGNDKEAWKKYMNDVVKPYFKKGETKRVWPYLVIPGEDEENARKLNELQTSVVNGIQAGQLFVYLGPDSTVTGDLIVEGFKEAKPDTLKNSTLLFVGKRVDDERVKAAVSPSGMTYIFHSVE
jgi:hypothetical protein